MKWKPIETMPKNGEYYLIWDSDRNLPVVANQPTKFHHIGEWNIINGEWRGGKNFFGGTYTHWMELPEKP